MPDKSNNPFHFWEELKRRKVVRVITVYAAATFVILELVSIIVEPLRLPEWTLPFVIVLLSIGFIISVILSWVYDITPEGILKTKPATQVRSDEKHATPGGWKISTYVSVFIIIAFVVFYIIGNIKQSSDISRLEKSIAVLPFENFSSGEDNSHLGDAIANEIATQLAKVNEFQVRSFTSSSRYKGASKPSMPQIGKELSVNFIIEGSIELQDDEVSIHVQIIQAKNDNHIFAEPFKGPWKHITKLRAEIALGIADELKTILSTSEIENIEKRPTENTEAYNLYLRGRYFWNQRTEENLLKAINYFNQAAQIDTNYALAYIGLADSYSMFPWYAPPSNPEYFLTAKQAALKALEIDNSLAEAHASIGYIHLNSWEFKTAEKEYLKAIELDPEYATAHHWYALLLACTGRFDQAIDEILEARNLDPLSLIINKNTGVIFISAHQYDKAIEALGKVIEIDPEFDDVQYHLARAKIFAEMNENVLSVIPKSENNSDKIWRGIIYAQMGYMDKANQILDKFVLLSENGYISPFELAILHFSLGSEEQGFTNLEKAYEIHDLNLTEIRMYPELDELMSNPRFIEQIEKMDFPE